MIRSLSGRLARNAVLFILGLFLSISCGFGFKSQLLTRLERGVGAELPPVIDQASDASIL